MAGVRQEHIDPVCSACGSHTVICWGRPGAGIVYYRCQNCEERTKMGIVRRHVSSLRAAGGDIRVWIVGGGPSVADYPLRRLEGEVVIAINRAWESCAPYSPACVYSADQGFWAALRKRRGSPRCTLPMVALVTDGRVPDKAYVVPGTRTPGEWAHDYSTPLQAGSHSGISALNIADVWTGGAGEIHLLGYDYRGDPDRDAEYDGYLEELRGHASCVRSHVVVHGSHTRIDWWDRCVP